MSWAKGDDRYDDSPKIKRAWRMSGYAVGLHWMACTASARHESDGLVDAEWLAERLAVVPRTAAKKAIDTLVKLGLFDPLPAGETRELTDTKGFTVTVGPVDEDTYIVHDYLEYNDSSAYWEAKRAKDRQRKADAQAKESGPLPGGVQSDSARNPSGVRDASSDASRERAPAPASRPNPTRPDPSLTDNSPGTANAGDRVSAAGSGTGSLSEDEDLAEEVRGVLQRGIDSLTSNEPTRAPTRAAILKAIREHRPTPLDAKAVATEVRSIAQSQNRAPNIAALYAQKLGQHVSTSRAAA